jgi:uncharacterized protein YggU (UPF0235/DUF167 family)
VRIIIKVTTRASENKIHSDEIDLFNERNIHIKTTEIPENGKANKAVINLLSIYLKIPKSKIKISKGNTSNKKIIEISD